MLTRARILHAAAPGPGDAAGAGAGGSDARAPRASFVVNHLRERKVIVVCGPGGVGKTTTAAALGLAAAQAGRRVLVLTIDPARRLAEAMGVPETADAPSQVSPEKLKSSGIEVSGELHAWMLNPRAVFDGMIRRLSKDEAKVKEITSNRLYTHIAGMVAGMQEYTAAEALYSFVESNKFDLVVLDTPPSRNALDFLDAPRRLSSFLDERILSMFLPKKGGIFKAASQLVDSVFSRIFGDGFFADLQAFLGAFSGMFDGMRMHAEQVRKLLGSDDSTFLIVSATEPEAVAEAVFFRNKLKQLGVPFAGYILNRSWAHTRGLQPLDETAPGITAEALKKYALFANEETRRADVDRQRLQVLIAKDPESAALATPHLGGAIEDLAGLARLAKELGFHHED
jgi:anion-transporting  ArsA/GET3 family ATPase